MTNTNTPPTRFIGCDVGQASIVVFDSRDQATRTIPNHPDALDAFAATLDDTCLVVCEATGGHEAGLLAALLGCGRAAHRADARKVHAFIRSFGTMGKTDAIDAKALSRYGCERHASLARWQAPDPQRQRLQALVLIRRDICDQQVAWKNRLRAPGAGMVKPHIQAMLESCAAEIAAIEAEMATLVSEHQELSVAVRTADSLTGIGFLTAASLIALMPELGSLDRRQAAALAGLAPHPRQSGASDAYRRTKGGRPAIRKLLFMAALTAAHHDDKMREFYQRLLANGKQKLVAITAVMRKLLVICNAMIRDTRAPT